MSESVPIPSLNHSNYSEWAVRMEAILIKLGFWDLVLGDEKLDDREADPKKLKAFQKRQAECKSELVLRVDDSQLAHMSSSDPKAVWEGLAAVRRACGFGSRLHIHQKFITAIMKEGLGIESWIGEVRTLSNKLKTICWVTPFPDASRPTNAQHIPSLLLLPTCTNPLPLLGLLPLLIPKSTYIEVLWVFLMT
jgi:hypothetical protein